VRSPVVSAAFLGCHADFRRGGLVVELDPETLRQFFGLFVRERAIVQAAPVERLQVVIQVAGVEGVPGISTR